MRLKINLDQKEAGVTRKEYQALSFSRWIRAHLLWVVLPIGLFFILIFSTAPLVPKGDIAASGLWVGGVILGLIVLLGIWVIKESNIKKKAGKDWDNGHI